LPLVGTTFTPTSADDLVEALCGLFAYLTGPNRLQTIATLVLFMEGSHDAGLREALTRGRAAMEATAFTAFAELGAHDPRAAGAAIAACAEGLLLHNIARHDNADPCRRLISS
jgi:hypothetical protein